MKTVQELSRFLDISEEDLFRRRELRLDKRELKEIPLAVAQLTHVQVLHLWKNQLSSLPSQVVSSLVQLQELWIGSADGGNLISTLPDSIGYLTALSLLVAPQNRLTALPETIGRLSLLQELYLWGNNLSHLPESIGLLCSLTKLSTPQNKITALPDTIGRLTRLLELWLGNSNGGNNLSYLPESIGTLRLLTQLVVPQNRLTSIPDSISALTQMREIYLWGNQLTSIPDHLFCLTLLTKVCLYQNKISVLPESVGNLVLLRELWLGSDNGGNCISAIPNSIGLLTSMTYFAPSNNKISVLPDSVGNLTQLKELYLWGNQLSSLPEGLGNMLMLTKLSLPQNKLSILPASISQLTDLKELWIGNSNGGNQIGHLPSAIGNLSKLTYFAPSNNRLTLLPETIGRLTLLKEMYLWGNHLTSLPLSIGQLILLTRLSVSQNRLQSVPGTIGMLTNLQELDFKSNQLSYLPQTIGLLMNLQKLNIDNNPLVYLPFSTQSLPCFSNSKDLSTLRMEPATQDLLINLARLRLTKPMLLAVKKLDLLPSEQQFESLPLKTSVDALREITMFLESRNAALQDNITASRKAADEHMAVIASLEEKLMQMKKKHAQVMDELHDMEDEQKSMEGKPRYTKKLFEAFSSKLKSLLEKFKKNLEKTITVEEVYLLLRILSISIDQSVLQEQDINGRVFLALTDADLVSDLHISVLYDRLVVLQAIAMIQSGNGVSLIENGVSSMNSTLDKWSCGDVAFWLEELGMSSYIPSFKEEGIDGLVLLALTENHLKESLQVSTLGHRKVITEAISLLKRPGPKDVADLVYAKDNETRLPLSFLCPIAQEIMEDPVFASDGYTYERENIERWFSMGKKTSPMTNQPLKNIELIPNRVLKSDISQWRSTRK